MEKSVKKQYEVFQSNSVQGKNRLQFKPSYEPIIKNASTQIISAFPMSGKTSNTKSFNLFSYQLVYGFEKDILDVHLGEFLWLDKEKHIQNPNFPKNYVDFVENNMQKYLCIFISSNKEVCEEMARRNLDYTIFYPNKFLKKDLLEEIKNNPKRSQKFYDWYNTNFESEIERIKNDSFPKKVELKTKYEFLQDFPRIIEDLIEKSITSNNINMLNKNNIKHTIKKQKIKSSSKDRFAVFAVHDDDYENGKKFTAFLKENLQTLNEFDFIVYNVLSVKAKEFEKALALGREYYKRTVGTSEELEHTVECNFYKERRPFNTVSLFGVIYKSFEEDRKSEECRRYGKAYMLEEYINGAEFRVLKNLYSQFNLNPEYLYTDYGCFANSLEILYMDHDGEYDLNELKLKVEKWLIEEGGIDKLLSDDKHIENFVQTGSSGKFENLLFFEEDNKKTSNEENINNDCDIR